ncbi:ABC transporter [Lactarius akahatsu]|uniref:ABC transporter n=1 Tax=Lactarius akahatsu TaxID=416441 RepID=A0AAD4LLC4_9AGAM|nr:ABC transporter [Lactarius akahatsu]
MGKLEPDEVTSKGETDLAPTTQCDTIGTETPSSILSKVHKFVKGLVVPLDPPPPKESIDDADYIPEMTAGWFSLLTFSWMNSLMTLGYARPLEAPDLWKLQEHRSSEVIANAILDSFEARRKKADEYNTRLSNGEIKPPLKLRLMTALRGDSGERLRQWVEKDGRKQPSLTLAINDSVKWWFWSSGILKVAGDTAQVTSPLILKSLIKFATESYVAHREGLLAPGVGRGIALAIGLVILQLFGSLCQHHFFYRSASSGVLVRGGLITAIYSRSLRLTTGSRARLSNGRLVNHISTDVSRIDFCCGFFHMSWTAPIQLGICLGLLVSNLGPSALAGFSVFIILTPIQGKIMKSLFRIRRKTMEWTDKRAKLLQELLGGMKLIKFFAWEAPFLERVAGYRKREMSYVRTMLLVRAANMALAISTPALASVVAFLVYAGSGHQLTPAVIFSSLTWFQLLRMPLMMLPLSLSTITDARNAIGRLQECFTADLVSETLVKDPKLKYAVEIDNASFAWDGPPPDLNEGKEDKEKKKARSDPRPKPVLVSEPEEVKFKLKHIDLRVPRGQLVAIVGAVGSGKTSLLQGLIGDMRRTEGSVRVGGSVAYCSQSAWIQQNATIRDNICFGRAFEAERYWKAVHDACLEPDLDVLPNGDMTEVGERGISLSGGQKQRVNICRAIYSRSDILIFDDPLSALDAHVGESVFNNVLLDSSSGATRILVTHALHFLPKVDHIYFMADGRITEHGTFGEMMANGDDFARTFDEFVTKDRTESKRENTINVEDADADENVKKRQAAMRGAQLMQAEERNTGAVNIQVYKQYIQSGNGTVLMPIMLVTIVLMQVSFVLSSYWLVWWQEREWQRPQGFYMGIYATLGVGQALAAFMNGMTVAFIVYSASRRMHDNAITRVMLSPMSFFETTPVGRIMNRFSKDIDTIDNMLADSFRMLINTFSTIVGAIVLISILLPWFLIAVAVVLVLYAMASAFYRASAREMKRLDAILRSSLYSHFSETLSGIATIRAYGEEVRFFNENRDRVNIENRAYWMTVTNQRWLGIRLDLLGALLILVVAMLTVGTRFSVSPAQTGVALSYILSVQQSFGWMVRQLAEVENNMNSVERIVYYARDLEQEPPHEIPDRNPPAPWPSNGKLEINEAVLKYRPELPLVLKGLSMSVEGGEKIGIVGRTGAGKSSIMVALFRIVELVSGSINIDGVDISKLGLNDVRNAISIIPQDPTLFSGSLRSNLDPFGQHDDARLWDALRRSYLVEEAKRISPVLSEVDGEEEQLGTGATTPNAPRFTLDSPIEEEGSNLSIGQRSLVSLARALVKDSKILILDEATASVDYETDRKIQETIADEFRDRTILCIAHRLRTIISYDRICVLDNGKIAEFGVPEDLYAQDGIFRGMCEHSSITLDDIRRARKEREAGDEIAL